MVFSEEDKITITFLRQNKNYGAKKFLIKFPDKGWTLGGLKDLIRTMKNFYEELRMRIINAWDQFDQLVIDAVVGQWRRRLEACVEANGGHFEHKL